MGLQLANQLSAPSSAIWVLIGSDHYWKVVTGSTVRFSKDLVAVETLFGWTVQAAFRFISANKRSNDTDGTVLQEFRAAAKLCGGRYVVRFPRDPGKSFLLGDNKALAVQRLQRITKKLLSDEAVMDEYDSTIRQYLKNDHAERVPDPAVVSGPLYYMAHHAVIRRDRETTKVRIVFDASSKAPGCLSLNETLHAGPNLSPDVLELLLQFRAFRIAVTADVEKAFLQILLEEAGRDWLRFLWYSTTPKNGEPLPSVETWRVTRVPLGAKSSPFLLAATTRHHLQSVEATYTPTDTLTASLLASHFYVDDLVVGLDTVEEALTLYHQARQILREAGFLDIAGFPKDLGCIDCTHVCVKPPKRELRAAYRNRKGLYSVNVQARYKKKSHRSQECETCLPGFQYETAWWHGSSHNSRNAQQLPECPIVQ
ncbi:uncharacterized protein LOC135387198 [Ornithodoros turicata]|uniref:uncharacterized protein LOC135387198 n=1 Tax=Ornithodoros turicata TaxID=34597 RepID=UPI0031392343